MTTQTDLRPGAASEPGAAADPGASAHDGNRGPQPVRLRAPGRAGERPEVGPFGSVASAAAAAAVAVRGDAGRALSLARQLGPVAPSMAGGHTRALFETLASLAAVDLTAARVAEAHLDALAILRQAGSRPGELFPATDATPVWGVFAAEASGVRLNAVREPDDPERGESWRLDGTKPWCSLAGSLTHALVTVHTSDTTRRLFAVDLRQPGVGARPGGWVALGLPGVPSGPVDFAAVLAQPIGDDGWYLTRPGFAWGGIAVAACWFGGAVGAARQLHAAVRLSDDRGAPGQAPDQVALAHLGAIDVLLTACAGALGQAAAAIDSGAATGQDGARLAARVRGLIARSTEEVLSRVGHALGPAPLAFDARHAQRVADLQLYVRQHHAERDDAALGRMLTATLAPGEPGAPEADGSAPW